METVAQEWDSNGKPIQASASPAAPQHTEWDASGKPIAATPAPPQSEGFFHSLAAQFGLTPEQLQASQKDQEDHPVKTVLKSMMGPGGQVLEGLYNQGKISLGEVKQAVHDAANGNGAGAAVHAVGAVPIVGQAMLKASEQTPANRKDPYLKQVLDTATDPGTMGTLVGASANAAPLAAGAIEAGPTGDAALAAAAKPVQAVVSGAKPAVGRAILLGKTPAEAYESAMKPSPAIDSADRAAMVQTGLQNEIPVSKGGVQKIGDLIDTLNQKIKDTIAADPNRPIDPNAVATRADSARAKFANQVNASGDLKAIEDSKQQFLQEQGASNGQPAPNMNAADAQAMKQGTYRVLAGKFGEQGSASVEAQKSLARGLKEEIATQFPELSNLNAAESRLLDLQPVLERAVNRISNHQAVGIGTPVAGVAAATLTGSAGIGKVAMVLKGVLDNPLVKSRLAIAISKSAKVSMPTAINRVNSYAASLAATSAAHQESGDNSDQSTTQPASPEDK